MYSREAVLVIYETGLECLTVYNKLYISKKHVLYLLIEIFMKEQYIQLGMDLNPEVVPFIPQINGYW